MAIAKKGLRKITVDNEVYFYKISRVLIRSKFNYNPNYQLDPDFMRYAIYYGLGKTANSTINAVIFNAKNPTIKLLVKIHTITIDSFMGYEQTIIITPKLVTQFIQKANTNGWKFQQKGDLHLTFEQKDIRPLSKLHFV